MRNIEQILHSVHYSNIALQHYIIINVWYYYYIVTITFSEYFGFKKTN